MSEPEPPDDDGPLSGSPRRYVLGLAEADGAPTRLVGGKGAHLSQLTGLEGIRVPAGFCITTAAYRHVFASLPSIDADLERLTGLEPDDREALREVTERMRSAIEGASVPDDVADEIAGQLDRLGVSSGYAVRSSATAEDLPSASFAGQHDSYLNVVGLAPILDHVRRCWASLFTERAVAYRMRNGIDHRGVEMAVIVQQMVEPQASGMLFTADPVTGNRKVVLVESTVGLGEALVSGTVRPDVHRVRDDRIVDRAVATKTTAVEAAPEGGTRTRPVDPVRQTDPALTDQQVLDLVEIGTRIQAHFGRPQDVEWCLDDNGVQIVQSRPITTLFPIPEADDAANHVYVSVGHQQMMTDPMTPLGISVWQLTSPAPMRTAGGRLFVDVTARLSTPASRDRTLDALGRSDPRIRDALETVLERDDFIPSTPNTQAAAPPTGAAPGPGATTEPIETDPAIVADLIEQNRASVAELEREIQQRSGPELFELILADLGALRALMFDPRNHQVLMAGFEARWWLDDHLEEWLGERNAADSLSVAAPNNVTAEMGLALLDVADAIRPHPEVVAFLHEVQGLHEAANPQEVGREDDFLDELAEVEGGSKARDAIVSYLHNYGMRCVGEIDIARPRWSERPSALVPMILSNVENFEPGESERRVEGGRLQAEQTAQRLLDRLRALPDGDEKAERTQRMIERLRTFIGYREYPKYGMVSRYYAYKQALLAEARRLVQDGVLGAVDDIDFLTFHELHEVSRTKQADRELIERRRDELRSFGELTPPRVLTSDGEGLNGAYRRDDVPIDALVGLAVSGGVVEGRARVVLDIAEADLAPGDILVTPHTDPSWSPLFVAITGLVTEVGGLVTHGAVIAREYGLATVVGVDHATQLIEDGQHIRVDGVNGFVEILGGADGP